MTASASAKKGYEAEIKRLEGQIADIKKLRGEQNAIIKDVKKTQEQAASSKTIAEALANDKIADVLAKAPALIKEFTADYTTATASLKKIEGQIADANRQIKLLTAKEIDGTT